MSFITHIASAIWEMLGVVVVASGAIVLIVALLNRQLSSSRSIRNLWLGSLILMGVLGLSELTGLRDTVNARKLFVTKQPLLSSRPAINAPDQSTPVAATSPTAIQAQRVEEISPSRDRIQKWLSIMWVAGAVLLMARCVLAMLLLMRSRRTFDPVGESGVLDEADAAANGLGLKHRPELRTGDLLSPVTFGWFRPVVCLPATFSADFTPSQQRAVLAHEFAHVMGRDAFWRWTVECSLAVLWWNPLIWLARRRFHKSSELAADEASGLLENGRNHLAEALVSLAARPRSNHFWPVIAAAGDGYRSDLGRRVEQLLESSAPPQRPSSGWVWGVGSMLTGVTLMLFLSACSTESRRVSPLKQATSAVRPKSSSAVTDSQITRLYQLKPQTLKGALDSISALGSSTNDANASVKDQLQKHLYRVAGRTNDLALYYREDDGKLLVRAPKSVHDDITMFIAMLNEEPQVLIESKFLELSADTFRAISKDWPQLIQKEPVSNPAFSSAPKREMISTSSDLTKVVATNSNVRLESTVSTSAKILTADQTKRLLSRLTGMDGVDILSAPRVLTLNGRQAQVQVGDIMTIVTGAQATEEGFAYTTTELPMGPTLDVIPLIDGGPSPSVSLTTIATVNEFLGYDDPGNLSLLNQKTGVTAKPALPRFRVRQVLANATLKPGDSVLLGGAISTSSVSNPNVNTTDGKSGQAFRKGGAADRTNEVKHLYVLITPTLIDKAGNQVAQQK